MFGAGATSKLGSMGELAVPATAVASSAHNNPLVRRSIVGTSNAAHIGKDRHFHLPVGVVTFLLTDVESSSAAREQDPVDMGGAVVSHYELIDQSVARFGGVRPQEQGEGDSTVSAFARASDAVACALDIQHQIGPYTNGRLKVRIALHTGEGELRDDNNYFGPTVNRCARLRGLAHGGQILLSQSTADLVLDRLPQDVTLLDLGAHRLRDLARPEQIYQLTQPGLETGFPQLRSLETLPNNLPLQLTTFIGREKELEDVKRILSRHRAVTLTGPGGCGKTRLGIHLGADLLERYADGVWVAELAPLSDPERVPDVVATSLGMRDVSKPITTTLINHLSGAEALLILDNCEHVLDATTRLVDRLLRSCPRLTVLATSRQPLGVEGEVSWNVPSLSLPADASTISVEALTQYEAVRLFIDRASRARPNFKVSNDNAAAVAAICSQLEGIPLPIELAAARVRVLPPSQISEGLADRFRLLTGGSSTVMPRQQTLQASVDWSYELLSEQEGLLLTRLSVFVGGFTLDAAEEVCAGDALQVEEILDLLTRLVERSLVRMEEEGRGARYSLLETIRQYARQKLEAQGHDVEVVRRHADYFLGIAPRGPWDLDNDVLGQIDLLEVDISNFRAAIEWLIDVADADGALHLVSSLRLLWEARHAVEGAEHVRSALRLGGSPDVRAAALMTQSALALILYDLDEQRRSAQEAIELLRERSDSGPSEVLLGALVYGAIAEGFSDPPAAVTRFTDIYKLAHGIRNRRLIAWAGQGVGFACLLCDDFARGKTLLEESEAIARDLGDLLCLRWVLNWRTWNAWVLGELDHARALAHEASELCRVLGDPVGEAWAAAFLGVVLAHSGDHEAGSRELDRAVHLARQYRSSGGIVTPYGFRAGFRLGLGTQLSDARQDADQAVAFARVSGAPWMLAWALSVIADVDRALGRRSEAAAAYQQSLQLSPPYGSGRFRSWQGLALLALEEGRVKEAEGLAHLAIEAAYSRARGIETVDAFEVLGRVLVRKSRFEEAVRVLLGAGAIRSRTGYIRFPQEELEVDDALSVARDELGEDAFSRIAETTDSLTPEELYGYARKARGSRKRPSSGWESLTPAEVQVANLAAEGMTNAEIAAKLFISPGTVKVHLSHIFAKLTISRRTQLASEVRRD